MIGSQIGQYQIIEQIGQGGMATVYKAYQPSFDRHVAIKVLSRMLSDDPTFIKRFQREAKVIARIEHRFIVPLYDYGEESGVYYMVMRLIEGGTLRRKMFYDKIDLPTIARIIGNVAEALDFAHTRDVIHRDLKPSNILLDERGNAFLTDFGIAKMLGSNTQVTQSGVVGTPSYMSPEQCQGKTLGPPSDVYALGAILFETLTGSVPYEADTPLAVMYMHVKDPIPSARLLNPKLPAGIDKVFLRALAKQAKDRYASASAMIKAFRDVAGIEDEHHPTPTKPPKKAGISLPFGKPSPKKESAPKPEPPSAPPTLPGSGMGPADEPLAVPDVIDAEPVYDAPYDAQYSNDGYYDEALPKTPRVSQTVLFSALSVIALLTIVALGVGGLSLLSGDSPVLPSLPVVITETLPPGVTPSATDNLPTPTFISGGIIEPSPFPTFTPPVIGGNTSSPPTFPASITSLPIFFTSTPVPTLTPVPPSNTPIPQPTDIPIPPTATAAPPSGRIAFTEGLNTEAEIWVMDTSGGSRVKITSDGDYDGEPDFSPNGALIAFEAVEGDNTDIYVMSSNGSGTVRLTTSGDVDRHPDWSPNGGLITYESGSGDNAEIWVMNSDGSNQTKLTNNGYGDRAPKFSPNGSQIAYMTFQRGKWEIAIMSYPSGGQVSIFGCPDPACRFPSWSPDGSQLAFNTLDTSNTEKNIYTLIIATTEMKLVVVGGENGRPVWSSDGKFLFFNKAVTESSDIYRVHLASGDVVKLTSTTTQAYGPDWGP